jgi:hypothetical protein
VPGFDGEGDVSQHGTGVFVGERDVAVLDRSPAAAPAGSPGQILDFGRLVEQRERALGAGQAGLQVGHLLADGLERAGRAGGGSFMTMYQLADRQRPGLDVPHADVEDRGLVPIPVVG